MEEWKIIENYPNYMISNYGNVKNILTNKILKGHSNGKGYLHVVLYDANHNSKCVMIHRLVALHFIPNELNLPQVNHIDECKTNNRADNLEWVTSEQNINHGTHNIRIGLNNPNRKPIYSVDENFHAEYFESAREASRYYANLGLKVSPSGIQKALKNEVYTYKKLAWFYQDDKNGVEKAKHYFSVKHGVSKPIYCVYADGAKQYFCSILDAANFFNLPDYKRCLIRKAINTGCLFNDCYWYFE